MIWTLIFSFFAIGSGAVETPRTYTPAELNQQTQVMVLLAERKSSCYLGSATQDCSSIILHETGTNKLHHLLVDKRSADGSAFDVNKAISNPGDFTGPIETFDLATEFATTDEIQSVKARFTETTDLDVSLVIKDVHGDSSDQNKKITAQQLYKPTPSE